MSNVSLITGDIHAAQILENDCISHTGTNLFEVTASGLSHTQRDQPPYLFTRKNTDLVTLDDFAESPSFHDKNYGVFEVPFNKPLNKEDLVVKASLRSIKGVTMYSKDYQAIDLAFDRDILRLNKLCKAKLQKQLVFDKLIYWSKLMFLNRDWHPIFVLLTIG